MTSPLPFEENPTDNDFTIMASKRMINVMFKWKAHGPDASGKVFDFEKNVDRLSRALAVLQASNTITESEAFAIITHLYKEERK